MALSIRGRARVTRRPRRRAVGFAALLATFSLLLPVVAQAAPSQDDIDQARAAENAAKMSVAQIEVELANVTSQAQQATQAAQIAAEELNDAKVQLQQATDTATKAKAEATQAQEDYETGRKELASVAQTAYRSGGSSLDSLAPYLESDGLRTVETKQSTIDTFGSAADSKMQRVAALEQVASIMKEAADKAVANQQKATDEVQTRTDAAQSAAESAVALQNQTEARRQVLTEELAKKQGTTVALIQERETYLEQQRQKAAEEAARKAAEQAAAQAAADAAAEAARQAAQAAAAPATGGSGSSGGSSSGSSTSGGSSSGGSSSGGSSSTPASRDEVRPAAPAGNAAQGAVNFALSKLGSPYVWGGEGPGYDCSGLVTMAYRSQGIYLTHWARAQYYEGTHVPVGSAQAGDLIFWSDGSTIYHVAISLGGNRIVEAPTFGVPVRVTTIYNWGQVMPYAVRVA